MMGSAALLILALAAAPPSDKDDGARLLIFLAEHRPVFVRLRVASQGRAFEAGWIDSIRTIHATLDRDGDGKLTAKEADPKFVTALARLATGAPLPTTIGELDVRPKDGNVSVDELAEALRSMLGPFRLQVGRQAVGRTDALFDQLDRDKDGELTRPELAAIAGSLRPLDLDDDEMIGDFELEPYSAAMIVDESADRRSRFTAQPPVVELIAGESSLRPARLLIKKYDKGKGDVPGRPDGRLSPGEFAIDPDAFAAADKNSDDALDTDELRKLLASPPIDLTLDVDLPPSGEASSKEKDKDKDKEKEKEKDKRKATVGVEADGPLSKGTRVRRLADGDVEFAVGQVRLDIHVDDGGRASELVDRVIQQQFKAADVNKDGYLEGKEQAAINAPQSPFAGLSEVIDRDGDGKIYLKELAAFADRQQSAARARLVVTTADQGRAIFGILDLDRDRRLGTREVMRTVDRVMSWDGNGDARVSPDEIPYHFQVRIARGGLPGLTGVNSEALMGNPAADRSTSTSMSMSTAAARAGGAPEAIPAWFPKMDRNHDGDVSRREFLGPRDQFDRLDRDKDGLIDPDEARASLAAKKP